MSFFEARHFRFFFFSSFVFRCVYIFKANPGFFLPLPVLFDFCHFFSLFFLAPKPTRHGQRIHPRKQRLYLPRREWPRDSRHHRSVLQTPLTRPPRSLDQIRGRAFLNCVSSFRLKDPEKMLSVSVSGFEKISYVGSDGNGGSQTVEKARPFFNLPVADVALSTIVSFRRSNFLSSFVLNCHPPCFVRFFGHF